ncbi:hypothetical protein KIN20_001852 [Parelaphostrongylus tenuis]|uniref:protein-serine/threonine phosphatase n=1 Tax=Parelaphostrongylus tenuis TaxID=148309 RepID=A0AAD5MFQ4_PARTN|nr:hypothetical protein KIN20_001852 [Parelaphostrongylus tenuis]
MSIAYLIGEQILCMHGGLSPEIHTLSEIAALKKPLVTKHKDDKHIDILWSDPHLDAWTFEDTKGTKRIMHYSQTFVAILAVLVSATYSVQYRLEGASLIIDEDGTMDIIRLQAGEQLKLKRQRYKMDKGDRYKDCGKPRRKRRAASEDEKYD